MNTNLISFSNIVLSRYCHRIVKESYEWKYNTVLNRLELLSWTILRSLSFPY